MNFSNDIQNLRKFVVRGNANDWKRGIVCGNKGIVVNIQQLKIKLNKSKSSLNTSLSKIGFNLFLRHWTIRELENYSPPTSPIQSDIPQPAESEIFYFNKK